MNTTINAFGALPTVAQVTQNLGILLMTAAATVGMLELPEHPNAKIVVSSQPAYATVSSELGNNAIRREKEDSAPHYISYSEAQRTPGRSGKF